MKQSNPESETTLMRPYALSAALLGGAAVVLVASAGPPARAQSGSSGGETPICMVNPDSGDGDGVVVVSAADATGLEAKGFQAVSCSEKFGSQTSLLSYRDAICTIASIPDKATQDTYEEQFGERPAVLCGMAERTLGQWKRQGER